ncbi:hypothetical protein [Thermoflexus hugenholtzii]
MDAAWTEPMRALQEASQRLYEALADPPSDRVQALRLLKELDGVLETMGRCLDRVPAIEQIARPGSTLKEALQSRIEEIREQALRLQALRQDLEQLASLEETYRHQQEEIRTLEAQREELRRLQALVESGALEALREEVQALQRRQELLEAGSLEEALTRSAREVVRLSESHLQRLDREVRTWLQLAAQREEQLAVAWTRLQEARERYRRAQEAWQQCREELEHYEAADRRVAQALPPGSSRQDILAALDQLHALRRAIEESLRQAIEENERQQRREPLTLGGPP